MNKTLLLIDAHALIHRAYHALPPLTSPEGRPVGALYGLANTLIRVLRDAHPTHVAAAFDRPEPTFRKKIFDAYKAQRPKAKHDLIEQLAEARNLFRAFGIPVFEKAGYEADDIIGAIVHRLKRGHDISITILTGDLDTLQLVRGDVVTVQTFGKGVREMKRYNERSVVERFGVMPTHIPDFKGLVGDASDNIPGVQGIGPKTAAALLSGNKTLEDILRTHPTTTAAQKVIAHKKEALLSKELATIDVNAPIKFDIETLTYVHTPKDLYDYFARLGFQSLLEKTGFGTPPKNMKGAGKVQDGAATRFSTEQCFVVENLEVIDKLRDELRGTKCKVAFNWKEICEFAIQKKILVREPIFDLLVATWLTNPDETKPTPESVMKHCGVSLQKKSLFPHIDAPLYRKLFTNLNDKLKKESLSRVFYDIEMPLIPVLAHMELWGIEVDVTALSKLLERLTKELENITKKIYNVIGEEFNINSPQQVAHVIFSKLNLGRANTRRATPLGHRKTDRATLEAIREHHPVIPLLIEYRDYFKTKSGFVEPLQSAIRRDGRVHTSFIQTGTSTGRLASEKPNMQNIPHGSQWAQNVRDVFKAADGWSLVSLDYVQLELKLLAHLSQSENLLRAFHEGMDIHAITASKVYNTPLENVTPEARRAAKTMNFGLIYGMGARALALESGFSLAEAKKFIAEYFKNFPEVLVWQERVRAAARRDGYVANENGRRRYFPYVRGDVDRRIINMPIQSLGADIVKNAMITSFSLIEEKNNAKECVRLLLSIHDELLFEIRDDMLITVVPVLKNLMEGAYSLTVPLTVDVKYGKRWGSLNHFFK